MQGGTIRRWFVTPARQILLIALCCVCVFSTGFANANTNKLFKLVYFDELTANTLKDIEILKSLLKTNHGLDERHINVTFIEFPMNAASTSDREREVARLISRANADLVFVTRAQESMMLRRTLPNQRVLFVSGEDPVRNGLVESFNKPGGQVTGTVFGTDVWMKQLEIMKDCFPQVMRVGLLLDDLRSDYDGSKTLDQVAGSLGLSIHQIRLSVDAVETDVSAAIRKTEVDAWLIPGTVVSVNHRKHLSNLLAILRKPAIWDRKRAAKFGVDMIFDDTFDNWQQLVAQQIYSIYSGAPISTLAVERPRGYDLAINSSFNDRSTLISRRCTKRATLLVR